MSTAHSPDNSSPIIDGVYDVEGYHIGKSLVNVFRDTFTPSGKIRNGNYFVSRSRPLIQQFYSSLPNADQNTIQNEYERARGAIERMESASGFRKFLKAKEYKQVARHLFVIVETASRRTIDQNLMAQISEAIVGRGTESTEPLPFGTTSTHSSPFSDSHETSSLADVDVGNLDQVEMSIFKSETTGEAAVVLGLHGRDGSTQEVTGMIPFAAGSDDSDRTDETDEMLTRDRLVYD